LVGSRSGCLLVVSGCCSAVAAHEPPLLKTCSTSGACRVRSRNVCNSAASRRPLGDKRAGPHLQCPLALLSMLVPAYPCIRHESTPATAHTAVFPRDAGGARSAAAISSIGISGAATHRTTRLRACKIYIQSVLTAQLLCQCALAAMAPENIFALPSFFQLMSGAALSHCAVHMHTC
jgi:hypothetical protein